MSYPILYRPTETNFDHNGLGILSGCLSCFVTEEGNGSFELEMKYPINGIHYEDIVDRAIIKAKADQFRNPQLFRVYAKSKPMSGIVTISAEHISYDLSGIPVAPFTAGSATSAMASFPTYAAVPCPFEFWTDKEVTADFSVPVPASIRSRLGGVSGSIIDVYGGELEFDNYTVKLHTSRGFNRGVVIRYGKNLTDIKQDENCANVYTGIYPYWVDPQSGDVLQLADKIVSAPGAYNFTKIKPVDFSDRFSTKPTEEELKSVSERYVTTNNIGIPKVSMTVSFAQLEQSDEYKHLKLLERVSLFDEVSVEFPDLMVSATAKAVKIVYDVILDRVKSVTLGSVKANIADTVVKQEQQIVEKPNKSQLQTAVENVTNSILGASGGAVRLLDTDDDGAFDTLYIADNEDPALAVKVWRFNYEGWGASTNGYGGPFTMGATLNDGMVADFITAGTLTANLIKAGVLQSLNGTFRLDLETGEVVIGGYATNQDIENVQGSVDSTNQEIENVKNDLITIRTQSGDLELMVQGLVENGVDKVKTSTGYTFKEDGLRIKKSGEEMENKLDHSGMYVTRSGEVILQANNEGVIATDVTVRNYLIVGENSRFEDYNNGTDEARTALFHIGG